MRSGLVVLPKHTLSYEDRLGGRRGTLSSRKILPFLPCPPALPFRPFTFAAGENVSPRLERGSFGRWRDGPGLESSFDMIEVEHERFCEISMP